MEKSSLNAMGACEKKQGKNIEYKSLPLLFNLSVLNKRALSNHSAKAGDTEDS